MPGDQAIADRSRAADESLKCAFSLSSIKWGARNDSRQNYFVKVGSLWMRSYRHWTEIGNFYSIKMVTLRLCHHYHRIPATQNFHLFILGLMYDWCKYDTWRLIVHYSFQIVLTTLSGLTTGLRNLVSLTGFAAGLTGLVGLAPLTKTDSQKFWNLRRLVLGLDKPNTGYSMSQLQCLGL